VARAIRRNLAAGQPVDFWSLRLPAETRAYVPKLLAMKRLVADPAIFGLAFSPIANQPYFVRVETEGQIDLKIAAEIAGVTDEELYELNPAFHRSATDPSGPHYLLLPADAVAPFRTNLAQLAPEERLRVSRYTVLAELRVPSAAAPLPPKVARAAALFDGRDRRGARPNIHVVRRGDSLWAIARRHGMDVNTLAVMNGMSPRDTLRAGQKLRLTKKSGSGGKAGSSKGRNVTYTVRRGDTLSRIARVFQCTVAQLVSWNGITVQTPLRPGQKLMIRVAGTRKG